MTLGSGQFTFTNVLVAELQAFAEIGEGREAISVVDLHHNVEQHIQRRVNAAAEIASNSSDDSNSTPLSKPSPVYLRLNKGDEPSIALKIFNSQSKDKTSEATRYRKRIQRRVVDQWEKAIPAKLLTEIRDRKEAEGIAAQNQDRLAQLHLDGSTGSDDLQYGPEASYAGGGIETSW